MDNFAPIAGNMSMADAIQSLEQSTSAIINSINMSTELLVIFVSLVLIILILHKMGQAEERANRLIQSGRLLSSVRYYQSIDPNDLDMLVIVEPKNNNNRKAAKF